ncbi:OsmC family protein [uncultured Eudoraea sp.]|uniref:OsmC family protein n=1 Tax=uncultured Eudoraea sp. TaxID=1035614 RepID=UPI002623435D|nr:OsmC family protein [uncultured Eudoraea sp.]
MTSKVTYIGELRTSSIHLRSGNEIITDAPVDNNGLGQAFSPTDTVATGLASCMLTMMGIKARDMDVDLINAVAEVTKHMAEAPRRISRIDIALRLPSNCTEKQRKILEHTARTCPVLLSLHTDIKKQITFHWDL